MQNSHPFQNPDLFPFVNPVLAAAYLRARDAAGGAEPSARDLFAALGTIGTTGGPPESGAPDAGPDTEPDLAAPRLDLDKLLRTLRTPIDLLLTVAELRAEDRLIDHASAVDDQPALRRVREAFERRLAPDRPDQATPEQTPSVRISDLLVVIEHLLGTVDLALVVRAASAFTSALAQMVQLYPAIMSMFARMAEPADPHAPGETCFGAASPVRPPLASVYVSPFGAPSFESPPPFAAPQPFGGFVPPCSHPPVDLRAHVLRALFFSR